MAVTRRWLVRFLLNHAISNIYVAKDLLTELDDGYNELTSMYIRLTELADYITGKIND